MGPAGREDGRDGFWKVVGLSWSQVLEVVECRSQCCSPIGQDKKKPRKRRRKVRLTPAESTPPVRPEILEGWKAEVRETLEAKKEDDIVKKEGVKEVKEKGSQGSQEGVKKEEKDEEDKEKDKKPIDDRLKEAEEARKLASDELGKLGLARNSEEKTLKAEEHALRDEIEKHNAAIKKKKKDTEDALKKETELLSTLKVLEAEEKAAKERCKQGSEEIETHKKNIQEMQKLQEDAKKESEVLKKQFEDAKKQWEADKKKQELKLQEAEASAKRERAKLQKAEERQKLLEESMSTAESTREAHEAGQAQARQICDDVAQVLERMKPAAEQLQKRQNNLAEACKTFKEREETLKSAKAHEQKCIEAVSALKEEKKQIKKQKAAAAAAAAESSTKASSGESKAASANDQSESDDGYTWEYFEGSESEGEAASESQKKKTGDEDSSEDSSSVSELKPAEPLTLVKTSLSKLDDLTVKAENLAKL